MSLNIWWRARTRRRLGVRRVRSAHREEIVIELRDFILELVLRLGFKYLNER
jgi:hypothetical protein